MLMRFDPFREFDRLTQQVMHQSRTALPMDAYRRGDDLLVAFDLPGVDPDSIDLTVEKNVLTVRAERRWQRNEGDEVLVSERHHGTFSRQLFLSDGLDTDAIQASYDNGVLTVVVPVAEKAKARKVEIASGSSSGPQAVEAHSTDNSNHDNSNNKATAAA